MQLPSTTVRDEDGIENCAYCSRFPCGLIKDQGTAWTREKCEAEKGPISEEDYLAFVEPFEGLKHLEIIHASLRPEDIVEAVTVPPLRTEIVDFPEDLTFSKEETFAFRRLHQMLTSVKSSSLGLTDADTFAQQQRLKKRRAHFLKFLWILGRYGEFKKENGAHLEVDAKTYITNRGSETALASWSSVKDMVFKNFLEFGVRCERVPLEGVKEKDLTTGTGYLRSKGWIMTMAFDEATGGIAALKALQNYTMKLDDKYGKKAFKHFSKADMQVLSRDQ